MKQQNSNINNNNNKNHDEHRKNERKKYIFFRESALNMSIKTHTHTLHTYKYMRKKITLHSILKKN